jgi:hypothetical protein
MKARRLGIGRHGRHVVTDHPPPFCLSTIEHDYDFALSYKATWLVTTVTTVTIGNQVLARRVESA